jgi:hypothetical protein
MTGNAVSTARCEAGNIYRWLAIFRLATRLTWWSIESCSCAILRDRRYLTDASEFGSLSLICRPKKPAMFYRWLRFFRLLATCLMIDRFLLCLEIPGVFDRCIRLRELSVLFVEWRRQQYFTNSWELSDFRQLTWWPIDSYSCAVSTGSVLCQIQELSLSLLGVL